MMRKSGYIWIIFLLILILVVDAYYQIESSSVPIWQTKWFLWRVLALILIILCLALYYYYEAFKKRKFEFEAFKRKLIEAQEREWKVISGELHDNIGQNLSAVNIFLHRSLNSESPDKENLEKASDLVVETLNEVRRISQKLYPKQIERLGLTISIQAMIERLASASGIRFITNVENIDNVLSKENEIQFFRIVQELLNNIIKHSIAKTVNVSVKRLVMFIKLYINDDGVGFDVSNSRKLGFGLLNIEERLQMIRGTSIVKSERNKGTAFEITIPVK
ncbi:MAG: sensor histidine kinase [Chlorobi bacterium]|nr:sensor histidine kinase [Chlorobiota bacterium]MCI0716219.1 sensor histidine kinase [Chlorobiota bacterium]